MRCCVPGASVGMSRRQFTQRNELGSFTRCRSRRRARRESKVLDTDGSPGRRGCGRVVCVAHRPRNDKGRPGGRPIRRAASIEARADPRAPSGGATREGPSMRYRTCRSPAARGALRARHRCRTLRVSELRRQGNRAAAMSRLGCADVHPRYTPSPRPMAIRDQHRMERCGRIGGHRPRVDQAA